MILKHIKQPIAHLLDLVFPNLCVACGATMPPQLHCFCFSCQAELPPSDMYKDTNNAFAKRMWGRVPFQAAAALYVFRKKSPIQRAMHKLKYGNRPDVGQKLGRLMGLKIRNAPQFQDIDCIVPVPLHPKKQKIRGYNQSYYFAVGLAEMMELPVVPGLIRTTHTSSQTRKNRIDRATSISNVFKANKAPTLQGKHILLVDDILTTGATLEHCSNALLTVPDIKISLATICLAVN